MYSGADFVEKRVVIVGAGPVGLIAAKELAQQGIDVTVYDGKSKVSDGTAKASGIFSKSGLERMGMDFSGSMVNTLNGATVHGGGVNMIIDAKCTKAYVLDRGLFVEQLAKEAETAGAKIILSTRLERNALIEMANDETVIVGADGAVSSVASAFGFPEIKEFILTYKAEYEDVGIGNKSTVDLFFDNKIAKRFFAWTVPYSDSRLEVGIGISSFSKKSGANAFRDFVATKQMQGLLHGSVQKAGYASIIPLSTRRTTVKGSVLLVGDAAGQVKATTGGGVIFGSACAKVAAKCIVAHIREGKPLASYEKEWRKLYSRDLKLHRFIHRYYSSLSWTSLRFILTIAKALHLDNFLSEYGDMDSPYLTIKRLFLRSLA